MNLAEQFREHIKRSNLFSLNDKLLLAVSGGVDSVVLCELCKQSRFDFAIAHCNFRLRGTESERDEKFVRQLGAKYGVSVYVKAFDTEKHATENKMSIQEAARELRYAWFDELINSQWSVVNGLLSIVKDAPIDQSQMTLHLLTGHHAGDNNETIMMNFFRGTGLHGLTGIPVKSGYLRRPLLEFTREDIMAFAVENNLDYVEDSSNLSSKYTRNFFRNELLPEISKVYPQVSDNLQNNIRRFREIENLYQVAVSGIIDKIVVKKGKEFHIPVKRLLGFNSRALLYEIISRYGFSEKQVEELEKLGESESGRFIQSPANTFRIIKHRHWFIISAAVPGQAEHIVIETPGNNILFSGGQLKVERIENAKTTSPSNIACFDAKEVAFPLLLRKWKTGDYFYPLGMKKKKKLSRFFIDQKLSSTEKERTWVIESLNRIIWVVGHRIDDRVKINAHTSAVIRITFTPSS